MSNSIYRKLSGKEIAQLTENRCSCSDWNSVEVKDGFLAQYVQDVSFSGIVKLGTFNRLFELEGGVQKHSGIYHATIHNCTIGDDVYICSIRNYIANYTICNDCYIENVDVIVVSGESSFGNGVKVAVLDETGGREVVIYNDLSSHLAYIYAFYKYKPELINHIDRLIEEYIQQHTSNQGIIGKGARIINSGVLKNICIGEHAKIEGASRLCNGSVNSSYLAPVYVGNDVTADDFIISSGTVVADGAKLKRCFVGQACQIRSGFSASDSLFFSNCHFENGEACALFAGPYTVSHHKSTLLIGCMFSFMNAGSGSNQSNHMYKLGPIHYGIGERGVKLASDSYIMWPALIGAFSLVMGRHYNHADTSDFPFSYLIENNGQTYLAPAVNFATVGTTRDARKWPNRDKRTDKKLLDSISFALLNPYICQKVINAINILKTIEAEQTGKDVYQHNGVLIRKSALQKGIKLYNLILDKYFGEVTERSTKLGFEYKKEGTEDWVDLSGLIAPKVSINKILNNASSLEGINSSLGQLLIDNDYLEWNWAKNKSGDVALQNVIEKGKEATTLLNEMIIKDAEKEFDSKFMTGFGLDGTEKDTHTDFQTVRGTLNENPFVKDLQRSDNEGENTIIQ
ncbi:acetyltransferase-like isoleucine patch superfamily enzyme [Dysgonomonas sp. PH5-45]|uniref:DUF4954 family protein n=1 Tax=unclassified Dysgonomonas TaxID=2630389 RepID=UPI002474E36B|nr:MULTISPECIES: DUF4954 family protein [unclassified Dysgonomonas]MDH6355236.1 acetyltransferase-like isoleucine patch superfamily enzyme [Dysgonomonas sp. PH5-45]MDH6388141.1 acetyltransferase-like isoleucine patch superfamily enzyme [Dysgonomonas sp. PH5-37]